MFMAVIIKKTTMRHLTIMLLLLSSLARAQNIIVAPTFPPLDVYFSYWNMVSCHGGDNGEINAWRTDGLPSDHYDWSNGMQGNVIGNLPADNYTVTVTATNGCTGTNWFTITQPDSIRIIYVTNGPNVALLVTGGYLIPPDQYTYHWIPEPTEGQGTDHATFEPGIMDVSVKVTDGIHCEKTVSIHLDNNVGIEEMPNTFSIYPNPVVDILHIETGDIEMIGFQLFNAMGQVMRTGTGTERSIQMSDLPTGLYSLNIAVNSNGKEKNLSRKILKQ